MAIPLLFILVPSFLLLPLAYLWHVNRGVSGCPPDAQRLRRKPWTPEEVRVAYAKTQKSPTDISKFIPPRSGRRYIVLGGSGLVGGSIVQQLLIRGEDPAAIRVLDLRQPMQPLIRSRNVQYIKTDVSSASSVHDGFNAVWPNRQISKLPLTVFHTVAYINASDRKADYLRLYQSINIDGTSNAISAARASGASILIATASGAIGVKPPSFLLSPFRRWPRNIFQLLGTETPNVFDPSAPLSSYGSCYTYSKAAAEAAVLAANTSTMQTGCIRPGHSIYGTGVSNVSSIAWSYLSRGGSPTWLTDCMTNFVDAKNVSLAHLSFESTLLAGKNSVAGRTYYVSDPGPPVSYGHLYTVLKTLAHPKTPCTFPLIPGGPMLALAYCIEWYDLARKRYLPFLPAITGDIGVFTPAIFNMCTFHLAYDNTVASKEIGYRPAVDTLEGLCLQMLEWNGRVDRGIIEKGGFKPGSDKPRDDLMDVLTDKVNASVPVVVGEPNRKV